MSQPSQFNAGNPQIVQPQYVEPQYVQQVGAPQYVQQAGAPQWVVEEVVQYYPAPEEPVIVPRPPRRWPLIVGIIASLLVAALIAGVGLVWRAVRGPLPQTSGTLAFTGLTSNVQVLRDEIGVPHIYADNVDDLFRAQGFVHAQDRFFEMDMRRHITAGRMAELVGNVEAAIDADKVIRTFGWRRVAEQEWPLLTPEAQRWLTDYANGVNAYISGKRARDLAMEYSVLGLQVPVTDPEPWTPVDSLAWLKALAWELRTNYDSELQRALIYGERGDMALVDQVFPPSAASGAVPIVNPDDPVGAAAIDRGAALVAPAIATTGSESGGGFAGSGADDFLTSPGALSAMARAQTAIDSIPQLVGGDGIGSNSWVVSGAHTASGGGMLANDPHLGLTVPGIFTQTGLHCREVSAACPINVIGYTFAGFPGVIIGHNDQLAWGITNMGPDVTDFFVEEVDGDQHLRDGQWEPLSVRTETIYVAGADPIELEVRMVGDRPIISDVLTVGAAPAALPGIDLIPASGVPDSDEFVAASVDDRYAVSLQWTALTPGHSAEAIFEIDTAHNADDMAVAASHFEVPAQALVFATASGDIGFQAPGRIPVREAVPGATTPTDGTWPRDGRDSRYEWRRFYAPEELPRILNPDEGFIVAANQAVLPYGASPFLGMDFDYGSRSERIRALLEEHLATGQKFTVADFERIQTDRFDPTSSMLLPQLLALPLDGADAEAMNMLRSWDGQMRGQQGAFFGAIWMELLARTFRDDLPQAAWPNGRSRWVSVVREMLDEPNNELWDDRNTPDVVETRDDILRASVAAAREGLTERAGSAVPTEWLPWENMHQLQLEHQVLGGDGIPGVVRNFVNPAPWGIQGSSVSVVASAWNAQDDSFRVTTGQAMRMIVDMGDVDSSVWVNLTGVSGHPASVHYQDQLAAWANGNFYPMPFTRPAVEAATRESLNLAP